jgi:hypothetical protein
MNWQVHFRMTLKPLSLVSQMISGAKYSIIPWNIGWIVKVVWGWHAPFVFYIMATMEYLSTW